MNGKKSILAFVFFAICSIGNAQNYKNNIDSEFTEYLNAIINMEFEKSMEFITPDFFEFISKSQMVKLMEQTFNNPAIEFQITNPKILTINDSQHIENKYYSLLTYSNQMNIKFNAEDEESSEDKKMRIELTKLSLEQNFGSDNVKYNVETDVFEVQSQKDVYGISENGEIGWKFLVIEKNQNVILNKLLPKKLAEQIKN
jgi:hypothetical protein